MKRYWSLSFCTLSSLTTRVVTSSLLTRTSTAQMNFLYTKVSTALASQSSVSDSLSHIEEQQNALSKTLDSYEGVVKDILNVGAGRQGGGMNVSGRAVDLGVASRERDNRCVYLMSCI